MLGVSAGLLVHTAAVALGLSALLTAVPLAYDAVRLLGAAYLIYLGARMLLRPTPLELTTQASSTQLRAVFFQGVVTNILNPKVALFFLAFLPQFVDPTGAAVVTQLLVLGLVFNTLGSGSADVKPLAAMVEELANSVEELGSSGAEALALETALIDALYRGDRDAFFALIDPVKAFGPDGAGEQLMMLVEDHRASSRTRAMAAEGLGLLEDLRAVDSLGATFDGRAPTVDDAVDDAVANSLASLGNDDSVQVLLDVFNGYDAERRARAAFAIAFYASDGAKQTLLGLIEQENAAGEFPADVIQELEKAN